MVSTLKKISAVFDAVSGKPIDRIQSYLVLSEILKILHADGIIHYTSYLHFQWKADFEIMCAELKDVSRGTIIALIADKYNRSTKAVEVIIYNLRKEKKVAQEN